MKKICKVEVAILLVAMMAVGCDQLPEPYVNEYAFDSDTGTDDFDAGAKYCPGYVPAGDGWDFCCTQENACGVGNDGECDCQDTCDWESAADCATDSVQKLRDVIPGTVHEI